MVLPIYFFIGMGHDVDVGCGNGSGAMSGRAGKWSSCSRRDFRKHYDKRKKQGKWCLKGRF